MGEGELCVLHRLVCHIVALHDCVCMITQLDKVVLCGWRAAGALPLPEAHSDLSGAVFDCERRPAGSLPVGFACFAMSSGMEHGPKVAATLVVQLMFTKVSYCCCNRRCLSAQHGTPTTGAQVG